VISVAFGEKEKPRGSITGLMGERGKTVGGEGNRGEGGVSEKSKERANIFVNARKKR